MTITARKTFAILASFLSLLGIVFIISLTRDSLFLYRTAANLLEIKKDLPVIEQMAGELQIASLSLKFKDLKDKLSETQGWLTRLLVFNRAPFFRTQIQALKELISISLETLSEEGRLTAFFEEISRALGGAISSAAHFEDISKEKKQLILEKLISLKPFLEQSQISLKAQRASLKKISDLKIMPQILNASLELEKKLAALEQVLSPLISILKHIGEITGFPKEKVYLVLLLNNWELRPGGGFIGTYGLVSIKDGEINEFKTDDIYNLDKASEGILKIRPPWQLEKYLPIKYWFLRDSNWSPDFASNAARALAFYKLEKGARGNEINGVLGLTPLLISELLKITGPIKVSDQTFNAFNLQDKLEWQVEQGYLGDKIPKTQRKEIIGELGKKLKTSLLRLPFNQWGYVVSLIKKALLVRQLMFWSNDPKVNQLLNKETEIISPQLAAKDYLSIVDANMSSLKTDQVIKRSISYEVSQGTKELIAKVTLTYKNEGKFWWKWTRYRTYTRVFAPLGSALLEAEGAMENDPQKNPKKQKGKIEIGNENGRAFFGAFLSVEPGEEKQLIFKYRLPGYLLEQARNNSYHLFVQKQLGSQGVPLTLTLNFANIIKSIQPEEIVGNTGQNSTVIKTDLRVDREIKVTLSKVKR